MLAAWVVVLVGGAWSSTRLPDLLANPFTVPATDSARANELLARHFGELPDGVFVVVLEIDGGERARAQLERRVREAASSVPAGRMGRSGTGGGVVWVELRTTLPLHQAKRHTNALRRALADGPERRPLVTGQPAIQYDLDPVLASDLVRGRAVALAVALAALLAMLGFSLVVAIPFLVAACSIAATLLALHALAHAVPMASYVTNLVELVGLALAIDYSLFMVLRFREEREHGGGLEEAVVRTVATAGRAVAVSGVAVAVGLGLMAVIPVPLLQSLGIGGVLIALASVAAALTLLPVLLCLLGSRQSRRRASRRDDGGWARLAVWIMRRPLAVAAVTFALLLAAAVPLRSLELSPGSFEGLPSAPEAMRGLTLLEDRVGAGVVTPTQLVVQTGAAGGVRAGSVPLALDRLVERLARDPEVHVIARGRRAPYVDPTGRYARLVVAGRHGWGEPATRRLVGRIRDDYVPAARLPVGTRAYAGGAPAQGVDFLDRTRAVFPWFAGAVLLVTYLVLLRTFRSLLLPLQAIVLNAVSVAAVLGILALAFGELETWIPICLFAVLFGLSMDYEVFVVSRIREARDEGHDTRAAVAAGLERTGGIVTAAALIMIAAFSGFFLGSVEGLRQLGVGLALGVLIDAAVVRVLLLPSLIALFGEWNWWLPRGIARLARVEPSPLRDRA